MSDGLCSGAWWCQRPLVPHCDCITCVNKQNTEPVRSNVTERRGDGAIMKCIERALRPHGVPPTTTPSVVTPIASLFFCCSIPLLWCCCRCISFNFTRCLYSIAGQSINQWLNSIWEPAEFAKSFPVSDDNFIQCEKGDSREREENFKKRESESARDTSTLVCRSAAQLDRTGPATRPIQ